MAFKCFLVLVFLINPSLVSPIGLRRVSAREKPVSLEANPVARKADRLQLAADLGTRRTHGVK